MLLLPLLAILLISIHLCICTGGGQGTSHKDPISSVEAGAGGTSSATRPLSQHASETKSYGAATQWEILQCARRRLNRPSMTQEEWQAFRTSNPMEAIKVVQAYRSRKQFNSIKYYHRVAYQQNPNDPNVLAKAASKGITIDELARPIGPYRGGKMPSRDPARIRIDSFIRRIRDEIAQSTKSTTEKKRGRLSKYDVYSSQHSDDPIIKALTHFRAVFRANNFDSSLPASSQELEAMIKPKIRSFRPFELPARPRSSSARGWPESRAQTGAGAHQDGREADSENFHGRNGISIAPSELEKLNRQYDTVPKKQAYIESLFDSDSLFGRPAKRPRGD